MAKIISLFLGLTHAATTTPATTVPFVPQSISPVPSITLTQVTRFSSLEEFGKALPYILVGLVGVTFLIFFIFNAYQYMVSMGNEEASKKAKSGLTSAVVGLLVALAAFAIINWIMNRL